MNTEIKSFIANELYLINTDIKNLDEKWKENPYGFFSNFSVEYKLLKEKQNVLENLQNFFNETEFGVIDAENLLSYTISNLINFNMLTSSTYLREAENEIKLLTIKYKMKTLLICCDHNKLKSPIINYIKLCSNGLF